MGDGSFLSMLIRRAPSRLAFSLRALSIAAFFGGLILLNVELSRDLDAPDGPRLPDWLLPAFGGSVFFGWALMIGFFIEVRRQKRARGP